MHFTVAERFASRDFPVIRVGSEFPVTVPEDANIRAAMRAAAWQFYGITGGTHIVRSFEYNLGTCAGMNVCWRNRPDTCPAGSPRCSDTTATCGPSGGACSIRCPAGSATVHPSGETPTVTMDVCDVPDGGIMQAAIVAHEFGHLITAEGLRLLGDEYWRSNDVARICGVSGQLVRRCTHSAMSLTWSPQLSSLCTDVTHDRAVELRVQQIGGGFGNPNPFNVDGRTSYFECLDGTPWPAGPYGISGWGQLHPLGAGGGGIVRRSTPYPHPLVSPVNYHYRAFANSPARQELGRNVP